jgi:hypothetical protein
MRKKEARVRQTEMEVRPRNVKSGRVRKINNEIPIEKQGE